MASFPLTVIRSAFRIADHIAPRLAGRAAFELFCRTPHPQRVSDRERRALDQAAPFMAEARLHRLTTRSGCVAAYDFRPPPGTERRRTVLVIHGWRSRSDHMVAIIDALRRDGARVIAIDLPGHGKSAGRRLNMANAVEAAATAGAWFGPFEAVIGHSFGGAVAVNALVGSVSGVEKLVAERLVLVSAPNSMPSFFAEFGRMLDLGPRAQTALFDHVERLTGRPLEDYVGADQLARHRFPTLVLHAPCDKEVPAENARAYDDAGPHVRLVWAPGLGHRRILAGPGVLAELTRFAAGERALSLVD
ncbi:alpha/beta fold hydrolase [Nitratireductor sp. CAU 1489]|uniref:Alpha/beta fold hydrolase n=1 Tax=Nitratireductor arenosus TaxID=2682096 RepID=A0A844QHX7_9HYPH|nr:alpha/beta fold hydrolase [Nitratireductor arenosus]MVA97658.1 alpha/beta fold hydrolase [Nitratireductor arenosus]